MVPKPLTVKPSAKQTINKKRRMSRSRNSKRSPSPLPSPPLPSSTDETVETWEKAAGGSMGPRPKGKPPLPPSNPSHHTPQPKATPVGSAAAGGVSSKSKRNRGLGGSGDDEAAEHPDKAEGVGTAGNASATAPQPPPPKRNRKFARPGRIDVMGGLHMDDSADDGAGGGIAYEVDASLMLHLAAAAERAALIDPVKINVHKTTWNFNKSPVARHSDAAAVVAAAFSSSAASHSSEMNGSGAATAVVTPAMEGRIKLEQGLPLLVVNHCLKQSPLPRRMTNRFFAQQRRELAISRCFGRDIVQQRSEPFFNMEERPAALESGDAVVAWHPIHSMLADATVVRADDSNVQIHWSHAMLSGIGTSDSHSLPDHDVMLVRRKGSAMSAPATPHPSLPPTPLRILASPKSTVPGVVDSLVVGAAGCLVAKLQAAAATASAHTCAGADSDILSSQVFHVARLLRYKVYLLQQLHSLSSSLMNTTSTAALPPSGFPSTGGAELSDLDRSGVDRSGSDGFSGGGEVQTPTTGRVTDITGMGSPRPSFSTFGSVGLASPFAGGDAGEGGEKQRRFEGENNLYALHVRLDQVNSRLGLAIVSMQEQQQQQQQKRKVQKNHAANVAGGSGSSTKRDTSKPPPPASVPKTKRSIDFKLDTSITTPTVSIIPPLPHALVESIRSARLLVRELTGSEAETGDTVSEKSSISATATRLFALLFLVKGIECSATSKVQGEHALAEAVAHFEDLNQIEVNRFNTSMRTLMSTASQRGQ